MIQAFYDDFVHILSACERLISKPGERLLINWFNCQLGESVFASRCLSFVCIAFCIYFLERLFTKDGAWMKSSSSVWLMRLALLFHPVVFFPVFYASQGSTSITSLWAAGSAWFFIHGRNYLHQKIRWVWFALLLMMSFMLRPEAIYYLLVILGSWILLVSCREEQPTFKCIPSRQVYLPILAFIGLNFVISWGLSLSFLKTISVDQMLSKTVAGGFTQSYPAESAIGKFSFGPCCCIYEISSILFILVFLPRGVIGGRFIVIWTGGLL